MQQPHARRYRPKCSSSMITLIEAGMSGTLLGNQAGAGYGGDNERLSPCLPLSCLSKTRRDFLEVKFQKKCQAQPPARNLVKVLSQVWAWPATQFFFRILRPSSEKIFAAFDPT